MTIDEACVYVNLRPDGVFVSRSTDRSRKARLSVGDPVDLLKQPELCLVLQVESCQIGREALIKWLNRLRPVELQQRFAEQLDL